MVKHSGYILVLAILALTGCVEKVLAPLEYVRWVEDENNGLKVTKVLKDFELAVQYKPTEYIVAKEQKSEELSTETFKAANAELIGLQYFTFHIMRKDQKASVLNTTGKYESYNELVHYFSFNMKNDLKLIDGQDTLDCALFHFERTYGLTPYHRFVLAFDLANGNLSANSSISMQVDKTLIYNDKVLGLGPVRITVKSEDLDKVPQLKTT